MKIAVKITGRRGGGYRAWCPALPGCSIYAASINEARSRIRLAADGYVRYLRKNLSRELDRIMRAGAKIPAG